MDLKKHLLGRNLKWNWDAISKYCIEQPSAIDELLDYCIDKKVVIQQNAGAVLGKIIDLDKEILIPHLFRILQNLKNEPHDAVKRASMRILQFIEIPEENLGDVFQLAINYLQSNKEPIAVKVFSMSSARKICEKHPELCNELIPIIEFLLEEKISRGIIARAQKELKILHKLKKDPHS